MSNKIYHKVEVKSPESLLTRKDLATYLQVEEEQLDQWEKEKTLPPPDVVIGPRQKHKRWRHETIERALRMRYRSNQSIAPQMMMSPQDVANYLRIDYKTVCALVNGGRLPIADVTIGNRPRWHFETIHAATLAGQI